jgi:hypothetical protein
MPHTIIMAEQFNGNFIETIDKKELRSSTLEDLQ